MNTHYEHIRLACIAKNPSILDLVMGCEVKTPGNRTLTVLCTDPEVKCFYNGNTEYLDYEYEILGRPITFQDVLLALGERYAIDGVGFFMSVQETGWDSCEYEDSKLVVYADLRKPLSEQSDKVLEWIAKQLS